jgi:hypothetical protein
MLAKLVDWSYRKTSQLVQRSDNARMRAEVCIWLSFADRAELESWTADRNTPQKLVWRSRIVLLSAAGHGTMSIVRALGQSKPSVWRWQERYLTQGIGGGCSAMQPVLDASVPWGARIYSSARATSPLHNSFMRAFYDRAADAGDGLTASQPGATFDPVILSRAGVCCVTADPAWAFPGTGAPASQAWPRLSSGSSVLRPDPSGEPDTRLVEVNRIS